MVPQAPTAALHPYTAKETLRPPALGKRATGASAALLAACILTATWLLSGVPVSGVILFAGYELLYALIPGCLLYMLLSQRSGDGWLRVVAIGWPLGYALEMGAFAFTAALQSRGAFTFIPLIALATMGPIVLRRRTAGRAETPRPQGLPASGELPMLALALCAGASLLALVFFTAYPLPGLARSVVYYVDNVWDLSIAAEARHHWPLTEPYVAGHSQLHYYYGVFLHIAAINQVTGIPMATVVLRLLPTTAIVVVGIQLWSLGRTLGPTRWAGPLAAVLFLVPQDLNLDPTRPTAFGTDLFNTLPVSPTFAFGVSFFLALLGLVQDRCLHTGSTHTTEGSLDMRQGRGRWLALMGILVIAASAVKTSVAVDFIGGAALFWLWLRLRRHTGRLLFYCLIVSIVASVLVYVSMLRGGIGGSLAFGPFGFVHYTNFAGVYKLAPALRLPLLMGFVAIACLFALVPLLGACWFWYRRSEVCEFVRFSLAVFAVSLSAYLLLKAPGASQGYFLAFGYIGILPAAAKGLELLWQDIPAEARAYLLRTCCLVLAYGLLAALATLGLTHAKGLPWGIWYVFAYGLLAAGVVNATLRSQKRLATAIAPAWARMLACLVLLLGTLGLVKPLASFASHSFKTLAGMQQAQVDSSTYQGMTQTLYEGLRWVRAHTRACDVLAVDNHLIRAGADDTYSRYYYYSAFTERRIYLESWYITPRGVEGIQPYPTRLALNDRATLHADPAALRELARQGVGYVLIDKLHGPDVREPAPIATLVFVNSALAVYRLGGVEGACA